MLAKQYEKNEFEMKDVNDYIEKTITFLEYLSPNIYVQRIIGRAPKEITLFANWGMSWWKIKDEIQNKMINEKRYQGKLYNYCNGKALKKFD